MKEEKTYNINSMMRSEDDITSYALEKASFQELLSGMIIKLLPKKTEAAKKQLDILNRMDRFMARITYRNAISSLQCKLILEQDGQIAILEQQKKLLQEESFKFKKMLDEMD